VIRAAPLLHLPGVRRSPFQPGAELAGASGWFVLVSALACSSEGARSNVTSTGPEGSEASIKPSLEASSEPESGGPLEQDVDVAPDGASRMEGSVDGVEGLADALNSNSVEAAEPNVDGAPSDAASASDTVASPCITAGSELCDDFESGQLDPTIWKINLGGPAPTVTVDGVHAHSGKYAVHAKVTPGQQSTAQITEAATFPAVDDTFYTRIWAYFSPDVAWPANPPDFHTGFIIAGGNNDLGHVELAVGANLSPSSSAGPMHYLGYSIYHGPPYVEFGPRSPTEVATLAWTCIELLEGGQGGTTAVRKIWVDGAELPEQDDSFGVSSAMGQKPPQFDLVSIGLWEYHPTPSLSDMWIDDVRVSSQRIGCAS
jgi:hypothetical protein